MLSSQRELVYDIRDIILGKSYTIHVRAFTSTRIGTSISEIMINVNEELQVGNTLGSVFNITGTNPSSTTIGLSGIQSLLTSDLIDIL